MTSNGIRDQIPYDLRMSAFVRVDLIIARIRIALANWGQLAPSTLFTNCELSNNFYLTVICRLDRTNDIWTSCRVVHEKRRSFLRQQHAFVRTAQMTLKYRYVYTRPHGHQQTFAHQHPRQIQQHIHCCDKDPAKEVRVQVPLYHA